MRTHSKIFIFSGIAASLLFSSSSAFSGGAFSTTPAGEPVLWQGATVTYRLDPGGLKGTEESEGGGGGGGAGGCSLFKEAKAITVNNADAANMVRHAFDQWKAVTNSAITINEGPMLGENVNLSNVENFWAGTFPGAGGVSSTYTAEDCYNGGPNCLNSIIFDTSGLVTDAIQGRCARYGVLGFAAILPQTANDAQGTITSKDLKAAQMVVSGACLDPAIVPDASCGSTQFPSECPAGGISLEELQSTITHEVGHFLSLDHTLVTWQNYQDCQGLPGGNSANCNLEALPSMTGLFVENANYDTLAMDDEVTFRRYYPSGGMAGATCTIRGTVRQSDGTTDLRCEEVVARLDNDPLKAAGFVSGAESPRVTQGIAFTPTPATEGKNKANCTANCGAYEIRGLPPGTYTMGTHDFGDNAQRPFGFILEPCTPAIADASNGNEDPTDDAGAIAFTCNAGDNLVKDLTTN